MGGKAKAPPAPNYTPIAQAQFASAQYSNEIAREQLDFAREAYATDRERLTAQDAKWDTILNDQLQRQSELDTQARADRKRYEEIYQPLEESLIKDAAGYTDERNAARADAAAGRAAADVSNQLAAARTASQDRLESYGIDPSQTRYAALDRGIETQGAAMRAGAANMTREQVQRAEEATGRALRSEALNIGRGYPGQVATNYGLATQQGQSAAGIGGQGINAGLATTQSGFNTMGTGAQWSGLSNNALAGSANTLNLGYGNALDRYKANQQSSSGWGTALGLIGGIGLKAAMGPAGFLAAEGGAIPQGEPGVHVPEEASPSRGSAIDDVPARVTPGEFIVPRETVQWLGEKHFQKLITKSREEKAEAQARPRVQAVPVEEPTVLSPGAAGTPPPRLPPPGPPQQHPAPYPTEPQGPPQPVPVGSMQYLRDFFNPLSVPPPGGYSIPSTQGIGGRAGGLVPRRRAIDIAA